MFEKILVPLDGSSLAEDALPLAALIAEENEEQLVLYRVVPYFTVLAADPLLYEEMNRMGEDEAIAYLRQKKADLAEEVQTTVISEVGSAAESILQHAQDNAIGLIVMSSHGRSGLNRWVYGSVAERVLSQAPCPTLIINSSLEQKHMTPERILVPLDGSQLAEKALQSAQELAEALGTELVLLRVMTSGNLRMEVGPQQEFIDDIEDKECREAQDYLRAQMESIDLPNTRYAIVPAEGTIAETIIEYASANEIGLIVMSSHGRTGISRWVYGSVAEKVLRSGCCATMIVRNV